MGTFRPLRPWSPARCAGLFFRILLLAAALWLLLGLVAGAAPPRDDHRLEVAVSTPAAWPPRFAAAAARWIADAFRARLAGEGFAGEFRLPGEAGEPAPFRVELWLVAWRPTRAGLVECTFAASLLTPAGEVRLGRYHQAVPRWEAGPGRAGLRRALGDAAESALADLAHDLAAGGRVPGFAPPGG